jgi:CheY-like chemotaxis protein
MSVDTSSDTRSKPEWSGTLPDVHVLLATDATWLVDDVVAALGDGNTSFTVCSDGRDVARQVTKRHGAGETFDIAVVDLQIGSMGGIAVTMALRLDASSGNAPDIPVLVLLDRVADVHLAKRSGADGWLVKPLDPLRLRRAVRTIAAGGTYTEHLPPAGAGSPPEVDGVSRDGVTEGDAPDDATPTVAEAGVS